MIESLLNEFTYLDELANDPTVVICLSSTNSNAMQSVRRMFIELMNRKIKNPVVLITDSNWQTPDEHLIHFATETGALLLDGFGDGICLGYSSKAANGKTDQVNATGRNYLEVKIFTNSPIIRHLVFCRQHEQGYQKQNISVVPVADALLFDLQETTAKIRSVTNHLKGVKIAIMGCIVNGPGEMADADFGYVGSGPGKITLYKGKEVMKRNVNSEVAVDELINLLKENEAWVDN